MKKIIAAHIVLASAWIIPAFGILANNAQYLWASLGLLMLSDLIRKSAGLNPCLFRNRNIYKENRSTASNIRLAAIFVCCISAAQITDGLTQVLISYISHPLTHYGFGLLQLSLIINDVKHGHDLTKNISNKSLHPTANRS